MKRLAYMALAVALPAVSMAQTAKKPATKKASPTKPAAAPYNGKTTLSGVYTREEADAGKEMFAGLCASCHQIGMHSSPIFRQKWAGKPISELFTYMRTLMPKNEPGSLADEDYAVLLAYVLQANRMPAGRTALSTDTLELRKIRFDTVRAIGKP